MPFTGKATHTAGTNFPELAEDVSDVVGIVSPFETPLLDHLGDPDRVATSTRHEWLEDALLPNTDRIEAGHSFADPDGDTSFVVENGDRFRIGDQVKAAGSDEVMFVLSVTNNTLIVARGYGATPPANLAAGQPLTILGNAAIEGADAPTPRFTSRSRATNYTQIFTAAVEVSGTQLAVHTLGVEDELDYQKQERIRESLRDLENCVINGVGATSNPQGNADTRRTMKGILSFLAANRFRPGVGGFPAGAALTEEQINTALREIWGTSGSPIDTILVGGFQKRRINSFITSSRRFGPADTAFRDQVGVYESDFGVARVILSRFVPADSVLMLDSSRIKVLPLAGRSFQFKRLPSQGDREAGQLIGEYTLELLNGSAHGLIQGLATS